MFIFKVSSILSYHAEFSLSYNVLFEIKHLVPMSRSTLYLSEKLLIIFHRNVIRFSNLYL